MKSRLFYTAKPIDNEKYDDVVKPACLNGDDVITARVSDHHPVIHDGVLFWNVMMRARVREDKISYNNGFGIVESETDYRNRLDKIGQIIADIIYHHPEIEAITLCEGPIEPLHVNDLLHSLKKYSCMDKFFNEDNHFYKPDVKGFHHWGLLMLTDKRYQVNAVQYDIPDALSKALANRFQLWQLSKNGKRKYIAVGHFPFGGSEQAVKKENFSHQANRYCDLVVNLLNKYKNDHLVVCADFNLNPYLISEWKDRIMDKIQHNNSILFAKDRILTVTVDGILLSKQEKQKYYGKQGNPGLFSQLKREHGLFESVVKSNMLEQRQHVPVMQSVYDQRFGLVRYRK